MGGAESLFDGYTYLQGVNWKF
ncbi:protein of unknown function (plasmid) [Cupriavidus neocaledonicus]|uniref:Uncharacterized protein n=1 Tax=Cupriavidus neocaledonicus TaxID=1040979 RepID=A0A375HRZ2_9BURK|nr:hypothetical protein CBM2605_B40011 [Cupriavidus neocaledonicus]SPD60991.1 protein of unknown function [Cupriavidus neocaledonicus]